MRGWAVLRGCRRGGGVHESALPTRRDVSNEPGSYVAAYVAACRESFRGGVHQGRILDRPSACGMCAIVCACGDEEITRVARPCRVRTGWQVVALFALRLRDERHGKERTQNTTCADSAQRLANSHVATDRVHDCSCLWRTLLELGAAQLRAKKAGEIPCAVLLGALHSIE